MLLLDVDRAGEALVQGFVRCQWPSNEHLRAGQVGIWSRLFVRSALLWSQLRPLSAAIRIAAAPGLPLVSVHSFVVAKAEERRLRLVLAAFLRAHQIGGATSEVPLQTADLVGFIHADEQRISILHEPLSTSRGVKIHYNLRLAEYLPRIVQTMIDLGIAVAYEGQIAPWSPPRELLRQALYDVSHLEASPSTPADLLHDQKALAERLKRASLQRSGYHIEECLTSPDGTDAGAVAETLAHLLADTVYAGRGAPPELARLTRDQAVPFAHHVHGSLMSDSAEGPEALAGAVVKEEVDRLLTGRALGLDAAGAEAGQPPGAEPLFTTLTAPHLGPGASAGARPLAPRAAESPFLFVSYARADKALVHPLVEFLSKAGVSVWIDRNIIGGEDWVAELEARLMGCSGVLALVSPSFASSKYCAREIHFADAINRPILPIVLEAAELKGGLNFILSSVQRIMLDQSGYDPIIVAIKRHAPSTFREPRANGMASGED
jgi:hypothetical protein